MMQKIITGKILADFKTSLTMQEKSKNTIEKYVRDATRFAYFCAGEDVTKETAIRYKCYLQQIYPAQSINSMLAGVNSLFEFLGWNDFKVKLLKVQRQMFCQQDKELTKAEYQRLCKAARQKHNERLNLILQTICCTGIRISELEFITVEAAKRGEAVVYLKGKSRRIFIVKELRKKLLGYAAGQKIKSGMIFVTKSGKPVNRSNIWREMKALCRRAGVSPKKVFPHNLRHLFARIFYGIDKDIARLADVLGHSSINTTRIYIISTGAEHRRTMENMRLII